MQNKPLKFWSQGSGDMGVKLLSEFRYIVPDNILYSITLTPIRN